MKIFKMLTLSCALILSLTACSGDDSGVSSAASSNPSSSVSSAASSSAPSSSEPASSMEESSALESSPASGLESSEVAAINPDFGTIAALDNTKVGWGQGVRKNDKNQPEGSLFAQEKYGEHNAFFIGGLEDKKVYLTFDEGYENGNTALILDTLKEKQATAVFFITHHYAVSQPELVQRMIDEGHMVGNHSMNHKSFPSLSIDQMKSEVMDFHDYMKENFDYEMQLFRFPMGEFSVQCLEVLNSLGYKSLFWSYAYADWDPEKLVGEEEAYQRVTSNLHDGAIYLLHPTSKDNAAILGKAIDYFREQGYEVCGFDL